MCGGGPGGQPCHRGTGVVFNCHRIECTDPCRVGLCSSANILQNNYGRFLFVLRGKSRYISAINNIFSPRYCIYSSVQASSAAAAGGCLNSQYKDT